MLKILVTGGSGFIGRWVVKRLLKDGNRVWVFDDLSNGRRENLTEFLSNENFVQLVIGDIKDKELIKHVFINHFDICYHLGASINVQDSIDDPRTTFDNDVVGTFNVLEECRKNSVKMVFMSTCMVYDQSISEDGIQETHPTKPASPYAGSKIAAENLVLSYHFAYGLPTVILRPFNTYGPFQKTGGEGGVVAIFIKNKLEQESLQIYGDGKQTRDLLYVEDCADFVVEAGYSKNTSGEIINAGLGREISINDLAMMICGNENLIKHVQHIHPQSEIRRLLCNYSKAEKLLDWRPKVDLAEGIRRTQEWIEEAYSKGKSGINGELL